MRKLTTGSRKAALPFSVIAIRRLRKFRRVESIAAWKSISQQTLLSVSVFFDPDRRSRQGSVLLASTRKLPWLYFSAPCFAAWVAAEMAESTAG
jgi:hypothetical protein